MASATTGTGSWHDPVLILAPLAPGRATTRCHAAKGIWYWIMAGPGANASCHDPVPNALCWARHMSRVPAATIAGIFGLDLWLVI